MPTWHPEEVYDDGVLQRAEAVADLRRAVEAVGSVRAWAAQHQLSAQYVSDCLSGLRPLGPRVLDALGLDRIDRDEVYRRRRPA